MFVRVMMVVFLVSDVLVDMGVGEYLMLIWFVFDCVGFVFGFYWEGL